MQNRQKGSPSPGQLVKNRCFEFRQHSTMNDEAPGWEFWGRAFDGKWRWTPGLPRQLLPAV